MIDEVYNAMKDKYKMTDEGDLTNYLGVNIESMPGNKIKLTQPHLIDDILKDLNFLGNTNNTCATKPRNTPAQSTTILNRDSEGDPHAADWKYCSIIGKLNFLEKSTCPELACAVHQAAHFSEEPKKSHTKFVHCSGCFLLGTRSEGIILDPKEPLFECYVDASFCGDWNKETATDDPSTARSRTGYLISFAKCPIIWASKLQTEYAFSTTKSEYIALSTALREVIPLMSLLEEFKKYGILKDSYVPQVHCKAFEDNSGACELAKSPKIHPRTKHINVKYHHFHSFVSGRNPKINVIQINTEDQQANIFTKPLAFDLFLKFVRLICGWDIPEQPNTTARGSENIVSLCGKVCPSRTVAFGIPQRDVMNGHTNVHTVIGMQMPNLYWQSLYEHAALLGVMWSQDLS